MPVKGAVQCKVYLPRTKSDRQSEVEEVRIDWRLS